MLCVNLVKVHLNSRDLPTHELLTIKLLTNYSIMFNQSTKNLITYYYAIKFLILSINQPKTSSLFIIQSDSFITE